MLVEKLGRNNLIKQFAINMSKLNKKVHFQLRTTMSYKFPPQVIFYNKSHACKKSSKFMGNNGVQPEEEFFFSLDKY